VEYSHRSTHPNFGTRWEWETNLTFRLLYPVKEPRLPFDMRPSGNFGTEKNVFAPTWLETLDRPSRSLVIISIRPLEFCCLNLFIFLNKGRPTWFHLFYYVNFLLNIFRMLIHPSSGACDYLVCYCIGCIVLAVQPAFGYHNTNSQSAT